MALDDVLQTGQSLFDLYIRNRDALTHASNTGRSVSTAPIVDNYSTSMPKWLWIVAGGAGLLVVVLLLKKR